MTRPASSTATMVRPGGSRIHPARARAWVLTGSQVSVSPAVPASFKIDQIAGQSCAVASRITMVQARSCSGVIGEHTARGAVDSDRPTVGEDPLRARVAKRDARAYDSLGVIPADEIHDDVTLLGALPGSFGSGRAVGDVSRRRAGQQDRIGRREDAALAQRADDPADLAGGREFL